MDFAQPHPTPTSNNDLLAAAAHLHVQMRRLVGRVTDTEWIAASPEYALAMVQLARDKAQADGHAALLQAAERLQALIAQPLRPATPAREVAAPAEASPPEALPSAAANLTGRYVGRLR